MTGWPPRRPARGPAPGLARAAGMVVAGLVLAGTLHATHPPAAPAASPAPSASHAAAAAPLPAGPSSAAANVALGRRLAAGRGWGAGAQWDCLDRLWQRESGWSATARNPSSGAYGIAQALGHGPTNQYPAGPANPPASSPDAQIRWGLGYIAARYGTPCGAWDHEQAAGWY